MTVAVLAFPAVLLVGATVASFLAVVFGDTSTAATITGCFLVLNTILNSMILRRVGHARREVQDTRRILVAPRQLVVDPVTGKPVGTILRLEDSDDVGDRDDLLRTYQRADDPERPST